MLKLNLEKTFCWHFGCIVPIVLKAEGEILRKSRAFYNQTCRNSA